MLTTLPNMLTLARIAAVPLVVAMFYCPSPYGPWIACGLFTMACITDWLDGHFARRWKQQSELGRFLDPIADKLLVAAVLFMLVARDRISDATSLPALVILMREILVSGLREHLAGLRVGVPVSRLAKWKTALQMIAIGILIVGRNGPAGEYLLGAGEVMLWIAAVLTLVTGYDYLRAGLIHIDGTPTKPASSVEPSSV